MRPSGLALAGQSALACLWYRLGSACPKHPRKNRVDVPQLALQIERALKCFLGNALGDLAIIDHLLAKVQALVPGAHGMPLHQTISILARNSLPNQFQQQLSTK